MDLTTNNLTAAKNHLQQKSKLFKNSIQVIQANVSIKSQKKEAKNRGKGKKPH